MRYLALFSYLFFLPSFSVASENPEPVKVYCFSADLEAGFKDSGATFFCKELSKRGTKKKSLAIVSSRDEAHAFVQYLGIETIPVAGEATYLVGAYAWTPEQTKNGARAVLGIGDYTKGFHGTGINDVATKSMMRQIESWIRENREVILEKARKK